MRITICTTWGQNTCFIWVKKERIDFVEFLLLLGWISLFFAEVTGFVYACFCFRTLHNCFLLSSTKLFCGAYLHCSSHPSVALKILPPSSRVLYQFVNVNTNCTCHLGLIITAVLRKHHGKSKRIFVGFSCVSHSSPSRGTKRHEK